MTGFPHSLKKEKGSNFDFLRIKAIGGLKTGLGTSFPRGKIIGEAYQDLKFNMFSFKYIQNQQLLSGVKTKRMRDESRD